MSIRRRSCNPKMSGNSFWQSLACRHVLMSRKLLSNQFIKNTCKKPREMQMRYLLPRLVLVLALGGTISQLFAEEKLNMPPEGFVALFNGTDLSGWKGLVGDPKKRAAMKPEDLAAAQMKEDEQMRRHWR